MTVRVDGVRQVLTRRRERGVLSVLLVSHRAPVATERLLAEVWGGWSGTAYLLPGEPAPAGASEQSVLAGHFLAYG